VDGRVEIFDSFDELCAGAGANNKLPSVAAAGTLMKSWCGSGELQSWRAAKRAKSGADFADGNGFGFISNFEFGKIRIRWKIGFLALF